MITTQLVCRKCDSENLVRNGSNGSGNPKSKCKDCGFSGVISSKRVSEWTKDLACASYQEKSSLRGVARIFEVSHQSILRWTKKSRASN